MYVYSELHYITCTGIKNRAGWDGPVGPVGHWNVRIHECEKSCVPRVGGGTGVRGAGTHRWVWDVYISVYNCALSVRVVVGVGCVEAWQRRRRRHLCRQESAGQDNWNRTQTAHKRSRTHTYTHTQMNTIEVENTFGGWGMVGDGAIAAEAALDRKQLNMCQCVSPVRTCTHFVTLTNVCVCVWECIIWHGIQQQLGKYVADHYENAGIRMELCGLYSFAVAFCFGGTSFGQPNCGT